MADTDIDIVNRALGWVGAETVADFSGNSAQSILAKLKFESLARQRLTGTMPDGAAIEWRFAMELAGLGAPLVAVPADKWAYAYNLPADLLAIRAVRQGDSKVEFDRYGDKLLCDAQSDVVIEYTFRQVTASWAPYFTAALEMELASFFAAALNRDLDLSKGLRGDALGLWQAARLADSKGRTPQRLNAGRVTAARF